MSQENVEVVRRWYEAMNGGTSEMRRAVLEYWDADADYYPVRKFPEARPCHGREDISQFIAEFLDAWSALRWERGEIHEVSEDRVLARFALAGEGRGSGMELQGDVFSCFWLRHGRFFRVEDHLTLSGSLRALGLEGDTLEAAGLSE